MRFHLSSEPAHILDEDGSYAVAFKTIQECSEPWTVLDGIGTADRSVAKFVDYFVAIPVANMIITDRWRFRLSLSPPTFEALDVRK